MNEKKYFSVRVEGDAFLYICDLKEQPFLYGKSVMIKTDFGESLATITSFPYEKLPAVHYQLAKFLRYATSQDLELCKRREKQAIEFRNAIRLRTKEMGLEMNITHLLYGVNPETLVIFYTAKDRIDFRQLLVWLRETFKKRIIMRQISADERGEVLAHYSSLGHLQGVSEIHRR